MRFIPGICLIGGLFVLSGCAKTTPFAIDVSKITATDATGHIIGSADITDWAKDAEWSETEKSFFLTDPVDLSGSEVAVITMAPAYPNPTQSREVTFQFIASAITYLRIALVDTQLHKQSFFSFKTDTGLNAYRIPFSEVTFPANKNYHLYYSFDAPGNAMYYKGHGDVIIK